MILVEEMPGGTCTEEGLLWEPRMAVQRTWRDDAALEVWVDVTSDPVGIRLAGVLDASTGANLLDVIEDCMAEGRLDFQLDTRALRVEGSGSQVLDRIEERLDGTGGRLHRDCRAPA